MVWNRVRMAGVAAAVIVGVCAHSASAATTSISGLTADRAVTKAAPSLHWNAYTGAVGYRVARDGVTLGRVTVPRFTDSALVANGVHSYRVRGVLRNGTLTGGATIGVTYDTHAPAAPAGLTATPSGSAVALSWQAASDASGIAAYRLLRDGRQAAMTSGTTYTDTPVSGSHSYAVLAVDSAGNVSLQSTQVSATVGGLQGRQPYTGVSVETGNDQSIGMKTNWPDAKIISITLHWNQLEPSRGTFNWGNLDASLKDAAARHYQVILRILCGFNAPSWIYSDAQNPVSHAYVIPTDDGYRLTTGVNVPVPWDPDLLVLYRQMMTAVANHLQGPDGMGGTLADHVFMMPVSMATGFGSEMVENFGQGTWAGTYNGVYKAAWNRASVNLGVWLGLAPGGSSTADKLKAMQNADTKAWINSIDAQESVLAPTGITSSVAYGFAFTSFNTATAVESTEVPKYGDSLLTMFTNLQPKVHTDGSLGPWGTWCPPCDSLMKSAIADGGSVGFQTAAGMMTTPARIEYATNDAVATYHPRFIETVGSVVNKDYAYFFTAQNSVQGQLAAIWGG